MLSGNGFCVFGVIASKGNIKGRCPPSFAVFDILHDVPNITVKDFTEHFDRVGADAFVPL